MAGDRSSSGGERNPDEFIEYADAGFEGRCVVCEEVGTCVDHHVSYNPEVTVAVCRRCHFRIHNKDGFREDLNPEGSEDRRQKYREKWENDW